MRPLVPGVTCAQDRARNRTLHPHGGTPMMFALAALFLLGASPLWAQPVRIATFNVKWLTASATENRMAPWEDEEELAAHRRELAGIIAGIKPDVIAIQEVTSRDALEKLAAEPALKAFRFRALHVESEDNGTGQDVAFLVSPRMHIDSTGGRTIRRFADTLPGRPAVMKNNDPRKQRLTKHALVCFSSPVKACALALHLLAHPDDRGRTFKRETQARIAAHIVRTEITAKGYAPIVLGDFNDFDPEAGGPSSYAIKKRHVLRMLMDYDTTRPGPELLNAALKINPPTKRYSVFWDRNKNGVRDARDPHSLLDHILVDKKLEKRIAKVEIRHDLHDGEVSDHWPVVMEVNAK
jgi:endonuclease/exonuclease/phosphatase family metal-dependent hydrolase